MRERLMTNHGTAAVGAAAVVIAALAGPAGAEPARRSVQSGDSGVTCGLEQAPMRDGVRLATEVYLPPGDGPFPVILQRTPYNRRSPAPGTDCDTAVGRYFAERGYATLNQDTRGPLPLGGRVRRHAAGGPRRLRRRRMGRRPAVVERQGRHDRRLLRRPDAVAGRRRAAAAPGGHRAALQLVRLPQGLDLPGGRVRPLVRTELDRADAGPRHAAAEAGGRRPAAGAGASGGRGVRRGGAREAASTTGSGGCRSRTSPVSGATATSPPTTTNGSPAPATTTTGAPLDVETKYPSIQVPALITGGWYDVFQEGTVRNFLGMRDEAGSEAARNGTQLVMRALCHACPRRHDGRGDRLRPRQRVRPERGVGPAGSTTG